VFLVHIQVHCPAKQEAAKPLELTWFGHACFRMRGREASVITDPYGRSLGLGFGRLNAEIVTISHESPNHSSVEAVGGGPRLVHGPGEYELSGVMITGVLTAGERSSGGQVGRNTAYAIEIDNLVVCHLGDLGRTLKPEQIDPLKDPDVLLVPVGGVCTIGAAEVAEVVSQLEPKLVIPMHYALPGVRLELEPIERFCREMGVEEMRPQPKLTVTRGSLPDETTVIFLEAAGTRTKT
jgi:L-ascorbate metabolism protein UlaG (beta-lactamase superfamily)